MSSNVLDMLLSALDKLKGKPRQIAEGNIAILFLRIVLGDIWWAKHIVLGVNPDPWMMNGNDAWLARHHLEPDVRRVTYNSRVVRLSDALATLLLGHAEGFDALRRRLQTRSDTRAVFAETEIASMLVRNGCSVRIVQEVGVRGEDFDLLAVIGGVSVSVEVTTVSTMPLTVQTLKNKLRKKLKQLPHHQPAVLYLHVPALWMKDDSLAAKAFTEAAHEVMLRSKRLNILVLVWEEVMYVPGGGLTGMAMRAGYNRRARYNITNLWAFGPIADERGRSRTSISLLERLEAYRDKRQSDGLN